MTAVSVILCTYNRCDSLRLTLQTMEALGIPAGLSWELLILDNNSNDSTRAVCDEFAKRLPLRYIHEPKQGKSQALNRSLSEAQGELLIFTDDDVDVEKEWLESFVSAAGRYPEADFFGGRVFPRWENTPPRWLLEHSATKLFCVTVHYDRGEKEFAIDGSYEFFFGANLAIRRAVFVNGRNFDVRLGPQGREAIHGEESALQRQLLAEGKTGMYIPSAVVHHRNSRQRMTERYVRHYYKGAGSRAVRLKVATVEKGTPVFFGAPRFLWRTLVRHASQYAWKRWTRPSADWLESEINMARFWGMICEFRRQSQAAS